MPPPLATVAGLRIDRQGRHAVDDPVIEEVAVALLYNGQAHAVMMATPADLEDFALGFALTEGVVADAGEFRLVDTLVTAQGISLDAAIPQARFDAAAARRRSLSGRSGCGLCGVESLAMALPPVRQVGTGPRLDATQIGEGLRLLAGRQVLNRACGGAHAAAFVHAGELLVREDVGRHNALDKVVGALARGGAGIDPGSGFLAITSRASYEIVHKAAAAGMTVVAAISAPTALAVRLANEAGITLIGFARGDSLTAYSHAHRLR